MSTATYPQGMSTWNNRLPQGGYKSWKGSGVFSNPVGITAGNLRPLTNNDPANDAIYKFGLPRPLKQYRRGTSVPVPVPSPDSTNLAEQLNYYYYSKREVKSSVQDNMIKQMMDNPGRYSVKENRLKTNIYDNNLIEDCQVCNGIGIVSSWYPIDNLTDKPEPNVTNPLFCCNQEQKARKRVLPANTNLPKNYYTTNYQYLFNRCQTFEQRSFNFMKGIKDPNILKVFQEYPLFGPTVVSNTKPGDPFAYENYYVANCNPNIVIADAVSYEIINKIVYILLNEKIITGDQYNQFISLNITTVKAFINFLETLPPAVAAAAIAIATDILYQPYNKSLFGNLTNPRGCAIVEYKPNNPQYAQQGAVSSSTRTLKTKVNTIELNAATIRNGTPTILPTKITEYFDPFNTFIYKNKAPKCQPGVYARDGNARTCTKNANGLPKGNLFQGTSSLIVNQLSDMTAVVNH